jgi:hypothetical protein
MYLRELTQEGIVDDAVIFRDTLNPSLWKNNQLKPIIRYKLLQIAKNFVDFIGIDKLNLKDITISGSNAAYTKKNQYNFTRNIQIKGIDVELYVQGATDPHHSAGIYSVLDDRWITEPKQERVNINDDDVENKVNNYISKINLALKSNSKRKLIAVKDELAKIRKAGLDQGGEFSVENLTFKVLRARGFIEKLRDKIRELEDTELSLRSL